jgi:hypothetical protein
MKRFYFLTAASTVCILNLSLPLLAQLPATSPTPIVIQIQPQSRDLMDFLLGIIQLLTLIGLIIYVVKTWQIASATKNAAEATTRSTELSQDVIAEMKAARTQGIAPQVVIYIDMPSGNWALYLVAKNIGKSVAKDVHFGFDPPMMSGFGNEPHESEISFVKEGIRSLAPGQELRVFLDVIQNYFGEMAKRLKPRLPTAYNVRVTYRGESQPDQIISEQVIDLSMFEGISHLEEKESKDIQALKSLADSVKRMQHNLQNLTETVTNGVPLRIPEFLGPIPSSNPEAWALRILAKLNEFRMLWITVYAGRFQGRVRLCSENLQSRISIIASQILILASSAPPGIPEELIDSLTNITVELSALSETQFYADGGNSFRAFNTSGDRVVKLIESVIEKVRALRPIAHKDVRTVEESGKESDERMKQAEDEQE